MLKLCLLGDPGTGFVVGRSSELKLGSDFIMIEGVRVTVLHDFVAMSPIGVHMRVCVTAC